MLLSCKEKEMNSEKLYSQITKQPHYKFKLYNHYDVKIPNQLHQIDLLFLPEDKGYRYALCLVDVASRYKAARPLQTKEAEELLSNLKDIYANDEFLRIPKKLQFDRGGEFNNEMLKVWANPPDDDEGKDTNLPEDDEEKDTNLPEDDEGKDTNPPEDDEGKDTNPSEDDEGKDRFSD